MADRSALSRMSLAWLLVPVLVIAAAAAWFALDPGFRGSETSQAARGLETQDEFDERVRDYLLENPEVLVEAMQVLQVRQQAAESSEAEAVLAARADPAHPPPAASGPVRVINLPFGCSETSRSALRWRADLLVAPDERRLGAVFVDLVGSCRLNQQNLVQSGSRMPLSALRLRATFRTFARNTAKFATRPFAVIALVEISRAARSITSMFDGFQLEMIELPEATLRVRHGGSGSPLLLLHGHPRTHATWHRMAPILASHHTVVCPDIRGFGRSSIPGDADDHAASSKRAKARDCIALMQHLGLDRFAIAGHDRGSYTAFRAAMDHPSAVTHLIVLDGVPILEALERCDARFATAWWHWFFFAQPEKPERAINADPDAWYGGSAEQMGLEAYADYRAAVHDPRVIHGMMEDYRAGITIDRLHDAEDREAGRRIECPTMVLWSLRDDLEQLYGDVLEVWRPWTAARLQGKGLDCGHHMAEEAPEALAAEILRFLGSS